MGGAISLPFEMEFQMNKFETMTLVEIIEDANLTDDIAMMNYEMENMTEQDHEDFLKGPEYFKNL
jgi:hypothetical protein